jgi:hypothetical protein
MNNLSERNVRVYKHKGAARQFIFYLKREKETVIYVDLIVVDFTTPRHNVNVLYLFLEKNNYI